MNLFFRGNKELKNFEFQKVLDNFDKNILNAQ